MGIEDEISELVFRIKLKYLDEKVARDIRTLIEKARSAPSRPQARWYIDWADSLVEKARNKVDEFSFVNQN